MAIAAETVAVTTRPRSLSREQLASLARTYEAVPSPVWVRGVDGDCLYRNSSARQASEEPFGLGTFDIVDHTGRVVAYLNTACRRD